MRARLALGVATVLMVVACAGSGSDQTTDSSSTEAVVITIEGFSFGEPVQIGIGAEVTVANADSVPHTWTSDDGIFDSGSIDPGGEFSVTFAEAGTYEFFCQIHPTMTGSITVEN